MANDTLSYIPNELKGSTDSRFLLSVLEGMTEIMEVPFLASDNKRREPILFEDPKNRLKVTVSRQTGHYLASIPDWDIVLFVAGKMQEIINKGSDIPSRTMCISIHEILEYLGKGKKGEKKLKASLSRLKLTGIEITIRSEEDGSTYEAVFGFLDSWGYLEDRKEIHITLSQWLFDTICDKKSLLKVEPLYFKLTSGLKRFLYQTALRYIALEYTGENETRFEFSIEKLYFFYKIAGIQTPFARFKNNLKEAVLKDDIPVFSLNWIERDEDSFVSFSLTRSN